MCRKLLIPAVGSALILVGVGCDRSSRAGESSTPGGLPALAPDTVLRVHWLGKRDLAVEGGAFYFNRVWELPETKQLEAYVFNRLTTAPWRLLKGEAAVAGSPAGALRPLLDNLAYEESYLEIRSETNGSLALALAIQLDPVAAGGWQTNLMVVVQSLTGYPPQPNRGDLSGWTVAHPQAPARVEFARAGEWTLLGVTTRSENRLMNELVEHVTACKDPFGATQTNLWLQLDADLNRLARLSGHAVGSQGHLPSLSAVVAGDGGFVLTDCELIFPEPFKEDLTSWSVPNEILTEPLTGFLAMRGLRSVLTRLPGWSDLPLGAMPDQLWAWAQPESAFQLYLAAPVDNGQERMDALSTHLINIINPWLQENGPEVNGQPCPLFHASPGAGVVWGQMQGLQPFARAVADPDTDYLLTGLIQPSTPPGNAKLRPELATPLMTTSNLVCLGWEDTASRLKAWGPVLQTARAVTGHAPMPEQSVPAMWLETLELRVNDTETRAIRTGPNAVEIHRKSTLGLNAAELHLMADWFESPEFPRGLHTFLGNSPRSTRSGE